MSSPSQDEIHKMEAELNKEKYRIVKNLVQELTEMKTTLEAFDKTKANINGHLKQHVDVLRMKCGNIEKVKKLLKD